MTRIVTRVVIADDHPLYREGVARSLSETGLFTIVGEAANGPDALALVRAQKPDVVLLDISMPGGGIATLAQIMALDTPPRVAMLTVSEDDDDIMQALKTGALGYILKGVGSRELVQIVTDLAEGRSYVAPSLAIRMMAAMNAPRMAPVKSDLDNLTKREEDILRLVSLGKSNKEVANDLDLQEKTIKHYMTAILQKLQVRNRTEAAIMAKGKWAD